MRPWREFWPFAVALSCWAGGLEIAALLGRRPLLLGALLAWACIYIGALFYVLCDRRARERDGAERKA